MKSWWGNKEEFLEIQFEDEDMELIGDPLFTIGVPWHFDEEFKRRVFAAAKSYTLGNKSIDYTLKKYGHLWKFEDTIDKTLFQALSIVKKTIISELDYFASIPNKPDIPSLFAASAAFVRLQNTFKAAILMIKNGMHFEAVALQRMILEQLSWIYRVHNYSGDFFQLQPSACIKSIKNIFPYAGNIYGHLSQGLHINPETTLRYIREEAGELRIDLTTDLERRKADAYMLLILVDMFSVIGECVYSNLLSNFKSIECTNQGYRPLESRPTKILLKQYRKILIDNDLNDK